jgi:hypothetical protein
MIEWEVINLRKKALLGILVMIIVSTSVAPVFAVRDTPPYDDGNAGGGGVYNVQSGKCWVDAYTSSQSYPDTEWAWVGVDWNPSESDWYRIEAKFRLYLHMETPDEYPSGFCRVIIQIKVWKIVWIWYIEQESYTIFDKVLSGRGLSYTTAGLYRTGRTYFQASEYNTYVIGVYIYAVANSGGVVEGYYPMHEDAQMDVTYIDYIIAP